ncbi:MAG: hypothetical protein Wins2KO_18420 [Winogradskyella sp.]
MKRKLPLLVMSLLCFSITLNAQKGYWKQANVNAKSNTKLVGFDVSHYQLHELNIDALKQQLANAPMRNVARGKSNTIISLPTPYAEKSYQNFRVVEVKTLSDELAAQFPNIKTYLGFSTDGKGTRVRFSITPQGLQTMSSYTDKSNVFTVPLSRSTNQYITYTRNARMSSVKEFECLTTDELLDVELDDLGMDFLPKDANDQTLRTFRIAISTTGEYTNFWDDGNAANGDAVADALAQMVATLNRSNEVFEVDMAINFNLVSGTNIIYSDASSDPYTGSFNSQLQSTLTAQVGEANYDIGHLFHYGSNSGNAGCIGCVCENNQKGSGWSSHSFLDNDGGPYMNDFFDIDYVPHEIGHQMGANHTFSHNTEGTGVNAEPGSGTTIMGYAGITSSNVQEHSDPYFHYYSILQVLNNVAAFPNNCFVGTPITNNPPVANAGPNYTIPNGTAFILKGSATDADSGDTLTYTWEQIDNGRTTRNNFGPTKATGGIWRSRPPSTSPDRYMPIFSRVLNGQLTETTPNVSADNSTWETVSTIGRDLNFALTVRDRSESDGVGQFPQSDFDTMTVTVSGTAGPFQITSQTTENETLSSGSTETITWDVAGTTANGINTSNVNILLSTDGGQTFNTVLATNTPNDGTEDIVVPSIPAPYCRIMIEAVDNIFYAVNSASFSIDYVVASTCTQYDSGNLSLAIPDGAGSNTAGTPLVTTLNIPDSNVIGDVKINVDVTHSYINDLVVELQHPNGSTETTVWDRECGSQDDFDVIFEDGAGAIACASPTTGTFSPSSPLNVFSGLNSQGDWTLTLTDFWNADPGTLNDWYVEVCTTTETLLVDDVEMNTLAIYPNPNNGSFNVQFSNAIEATEIGVFDVRGRLIFNKTYNVSGDFNQNIDLGQVQSGVYLVKVNNGKNTVTKRFIVE